MDVAITHPSHGAFNLAYLDHDRYKGLDATLFPDLQVMRDQVDARMEAKRERGGG